MKTRGNFVSEDLFRQWQSKTVASWRAGRGNQIPEAQRDKITQDSAAGFFFLSDHRKLTIASPMLVPGSLADLLAVEEPNVKQEHIPSYTIVRNDEGQYSIWPAHRPAPDGWVACELEADRQTCLSRINDLWTEMHPNCFLQHIRNR